MYLSILLHVLAVALLLLLSPKPASISNPFKPRREKNRILLSPVPSPSKGGGGTNSPTPPSRGRLPRYATFQIVPPMPTVENPRLTVEPSIVVEAPVQLASTAMPIGLPSGIPGPPSGGPGRLGGIGDGEGLGIGNNRGSGLEGIVAEPLRAGMKPPIPIYKLEPEYSEQGRKARIQGTVIVDGVIDENGGTRALKIREGLGFGLDEQAIDAVKKWKFRPATKDGKPLPVYGTFYLTFRLL